MRKVIRFRISLVITFVVTALLIIVFAIVTTLVLRTLNHSLKQSLINQSQSFAVLSTRPLGDAFILYEDSGRTILAQQIEEIISSETFIGNLTIVNVNGQVLYRHRGEPIQVTSEKASTFEPIFEFDNDGFLTHVTYPFLEQNGVHRYTLIFEINSAEIKATLASTQNDILLVALGVLILSDILLIVFIEILFVSPLKKMSRLAASISSGNYNVQIYHRRNDEIADLHNALGTMAQKLAADIQALKDADKLKSEFLIISSHNFRTPLTVITGYLDLLKDTPMDDQTRKYLKTISDHTQELTDLTNDMLTVAELEGREQPKLNLELVNLNDLVNNQVTMIKQKLALKQQVLNLRLDEQPVLVHAHLTYLQTILWNLVDNASKFTPEKGIVSINLTRSNNQAVIGVSDTGVGISAEEMPKLFTKFHRGTSIMRYEYEGVGLGLYMVKLMLTYMGGTIEAQSEESKGSTFTIRLPLDQTEPSNPSTDDHLLINQQSNIKIPIQESE